MLQNETCKVQHTVFRAKWFVLKYDSSESTHIFFTWPQLSVCAWVLMEISVGWRYHHFLRKDQGQNKWCAWIIILYINVKVQKTDLDKSVSYVICNVKLKMLLVVVVLSDMHCAVSSLKSLNLYYYHYFCTATTTSTTSCCTRRLKCF